MSKFDEEYFELQNSTKKKKKKKDEDKKKSFSEQYEELQANPVGSVLAGGVKQSIERTTTPLRVGKSALAGFGSEEIAPTFGNKRTTGKFGGDKEEEEEERKWFDNGAFDDGYDFGDVTRTILGTVTDTAENLGAGIIGMGEKIVDAAAWLGAHSYGGLTPTTTKGAFGLPTTVYTYSAEDRVKAKEDALDFMAKDLYDEEKVAKKIISNPIRNLTGVDAEEDSVFGEKSDSLVQSAGQLAATVGLNAVGVPWFVTTGVTSFGGELENAAKQGATFGQAGASAAITAGAEILTEKLSGGIKFGGKALDDLAVSRLSRAISNKTLRTMAKFGMDAVGEGSEEIISQVFSNLGSSLYKEESLGELLASEEAVDEYIESFIGGAVLGGVSSGINTVKSNAQGVDAVSGLTKNEQAVVDKVYKDAVAEQEQDGKKLTQKEKDKLYNEVLDQMDKGYISTDTIEEVLGGETYKNYKNTVDYENTLLEEWENLGNKQNATLAEQTRYNELLEKKKNLEQTSQRNALKSQLSEEVFGMVQSDRLAESYNERGRRSKAFEADLTKYDSKAQETIKKAIDSGILNNTNRTHEFVDLIAKISADKGVPFDFTNNQRLKDSGFAVEGKQVNGFVHNGNITLNIDSAKALQSTVGHEVTHVLEGTELYDALSQSVIEYAKSKGDYQGRYDTLSKLYEGIEGANIDAELTADLVGDYLFADTDFIHNLSTTNRNVFQKIYDEIKYLVKVATAGSKEARELAKVQKAFEDAYRASGKGAEGTKYSLTDNSGKQLTKEQQDYFKDSKMRDDDGNLMVMYHGSQDAGFHVFDASMSDDDTSFFFVDRNDVAASYSGTTETYEAKTIRSAEDMNNFLAEIEQGEDYSVIEKDGKFELIYDGDRVASSDTAQGIYEEFCWYEGVGEGDANYKVYLNLKNPLEVDAKGRNWNNVTSEFSQELADRYKSLTAEEKYALTELAEWEDYALFKDEIEMAVRQYNDEETQPIRNAYEKLLGNDTEVDKYTLFSIASENFSDEAIKEYAFIHLTTRDFAQKAKAEGYDGVIFKNIHDNGGYSNGSEGASTVAIAFDSNQIKSVANEKPTADKDIRYSISGVRAQTANSSMLLKAERMLDTGVDSETVRQATGWYKGYDGKMRFEIDDSKSELIENPDLEKHEHDGTPYFTGKLSDILNHSELYEAYPQLRNVNIIIQETEPGTRGIYQPNSNYLTLSLELFKRRTSEYSELLSSREEEIARIEQTPEYKEYNKWYEDEELSEKMAPEKWLEEEKKARDKFFNSELGKQYYQLKWGKVNVKKSEFGWGKEAREVLMHEVQHAIQKIENFASGSSPGYWKSVLASGDTIQTAGQKAELAEARKKLRAIYDQNHRFYLDMTNLLGSTPTIPRGQILDWETLEQEEDPIEWQAFDKRRDALEEKYGTLEVFDFMDLYYDVVRFRKRSLSADDAYFRTAGEIEARDTANRLNLTAEERRSKRPNIDSTDIVLTDRYSLSFNGEAPVRRRSDIYGKDIKLETVAPVQDSVQVPVQTVAENATVEPLFPDDMAPVQTELDQLVQEQRTLEAEIQEAYNADDSDRVLQLTERYGEVVERIRVLEDEVSTADAGRIDSLSDADVPPEVDAPYQPQTISKVDPFEDKEMAEVGSPKVKAYMYENPEVKPFFQAEAAVMLDELNNSTKGEKWWAWGDFDGYGAESYYRVGGTKRDTSSDIAYLLDGNWNGGKNGYTYDQIEKGLLAIIEDHGAENNAVSKRIEFLLNDRLLNGYKDYFTRRYVEPNQDYIEMCKVKNVTEYSKEAFDALMANADEYAPISEEIVEDIAPVVAPAAPVKEAYEAIRPKPAKEPRMAKATPQEQARANILVEEPKVEKKKSGAWNLFKDNFVDKGTIFETIGLKSGNRELQGRWKAIGRAESSAQWFMEHGNASTSSLKSIRDTVEQSGKTQQFYEYLYHQHNVDRMNLVARNMDEVDKPVFGYDVTSEMSKAEASKLEAENPEFREWAEEVYAYNRSLRQSMVDGGVISQETADWWEKKYPHYVPVRRKGDEGLNINVALDTKRTGVNAPVKKATGGNRDILPLFDTMAMRTEQTFKAVARNRFGVELKNLIAPNVETEAVDIDEIIDSVDSHEELLQEGKDGRNPTFTVFDNGEKVTFEITDEMYDTMKPKSKAMGYTNKVLNKVNDVRRGLLTEYNPAFMLTNPIKDTQDVLMNSQHPARTYANYPKAIAELWGKKGQYYQEYMEHGGEMNTYFDGEKKTFADKKGVPILRKISQANNFIERIPRMAEYIASRKEGRSIEVSMLDAARVTTDFSAGGDLVKFANRNGFTFLNASVQGAVQQVRNVREAKAEGLKGWAKLAAKVAVAGLPSVLLNHLLWDDDEEYAELSDYVKQNYYIVGKYGDGKFVRIPKGRALAVIQNGFEQMENLVTGNDEVDLRTFGELVLSNLAPNNPLENNLIAPITQALGNKTWYGEDLVPTRLQDLPAEEQYDETTDAISKWLGEHTNTSPYKWNYVLDQYSGAVGDMLLPMITPEAERGNDTIAGNLIAPITDKFTTDSVMKNQNVSDFYDKKDELTMNAKASGATEEDVLMNKYMNSINSELSELYAEKRKIQNSELSNAEKYEAVREIQKQIVDLTREGLATYDDISYQTARDGEYVNIGNRYFKQDDEGEWQKLSDEQVTKYKVTSAAGDSSYASDGKNHYRWYVSEDGETEGWRKISGDELERQNEVTKGLGITPEAYWNNKEEYSYAYDYPENYAVAKTVGGYEAYKGYSSDLYDIKADKDKYGKSITGSRKEKVADYINNLDADYYTKIILWKSEYNSDDTYNYEIIEYLNGRSDISFEEEIVILRKLGFEVDSKGNISW